MIRTTAIAAFFWPGAVLAFEPMLPDMAIAVADRTTPESQYAVPVGVYNGGKMPVVQVAGTVIRRTWRIEETSATLNDLTAVLRNQLSAEGYEILVDCQAAGCGGFDFRFATEVLPPPDMFVDLGAYQFLSARMDTDNGQDGLGIFVSQTRLASMVQVIEVVQSRSTPVVSEEPKRPVARPETPRETQNSDVIKILIGQGHVVLGDLVFSTGSVNLGENQFETLAILADWLLQDAARKVALVGHTDTQGGAEPNLTLSEGRAKAVMIRLQEQYQVPKEQMHARGVGYFSPLTTNATSAGREENRRVEVVLVDTPQ